MSADPRLARVVVIDDQRSFAESLTLSLSLSEDMRVVGTAQNESEGYDLILATGPDLAVIDYRLSATANGLDLAKRIREHSDATGPDIANTPILILTGFAVPQVVRGAQELEAVQVISKNDSLSALVAAFRLALNGDVISMPDTEIAAGLTKAELEVLELLGQGLQVAAIAETLVLSVSAIRSRIRSVLRKLDVTSQLEAVAQGTAMGLLVPPANA